MEKFTEDLSLSSTILEKKTDEKSRKALVTFLKEDAVSANGRFYPAQVVREAVKDLVGKPSFIGHETDEVDRIVARITSAGMVGPLATATFSFGEDEHSQMIFDKVKSGLIDSVSIRASGRTRPGKVNGEELSIVEELEISSIDLVAFSGIPEAKITKVFESAPKIEFIDEKNIKPYIYEQISSLQKFIAECETKFESTFEPRNGKSVVEWLEGEIETDLEDWISFAEKIGAHLSSPKFLVDYKAKQIKENLKQRFEQVHEESLKRKLDENYVPIHPIEWITEGKNQIGKFGNVNSLLSSPALNESEKINCLISLLGCEPKPITENTKKFSNVNQLLESGELSDSERVNILTELLR